MHVGSVEWAIAQCPQRRTVVQAGGNVGLWPARLAQDFWRVLTFEPDDASRACLVRNVPPSVEVYEAALGDQMGRCAIAHRSLGSHQVVDGDTVPVTTIDAFYLSDLDFLQLDVEGHEWHALRGAAETVARCHPLIQVELRNHTTRYGQSDEAVRALLAEWGYVQVSSQQGSDFVFGWRP